MSLFVQEKEKLTDLVSEKVTRLVETLEIDTLYFIKSHLYYNALCSHVTPYCGLPLCQFFASVILSS